MRRIYFLLFVLLTAINIQGHVFTENGIKYGTWATDNYGYYLYDFKEDVELIVVGIEDKSFSGQLVIPESVVYDNKTLIVKYIGGEAFKGCENITSVIIPASVTYIEDNAFKDCTSLSTFNIPSPIEYVGYETFHNTAWYNSLPDGLIYKDNVLYGYKTDRPEGSMKVAEGTRVIASNAFQYSFDLTSVEFPSSLFTIGNSAFFQTDITSITIPRSVKSIGWQAFHCCSKLESITVESGNPVFDSRDNCNAIIETENNELAFGCMNTVIPNTVTSIRDGAFRGHIDLVEITLPSSISKIGAFAFGECYPEKIISKITEPFAIYGKSSGSYTKTFLYHDRQTLYVPAGTKALYEATEGWQDFKNIVEMEPEKKDLEVGDTFTADGITYKVTDADLKEVQVGDGENAAVDKEFDGSVNINSSVTCPSSGENYSVVSIGDAAFKRCSRISSIELPNGILTIGEGAFWGLKVNSLTIPNTVRNIGARAFWGCTELTSLSLPESVNSIGDEAFQSCHALTSINIPRSVESIGVGAFSDCYKVGEIIVDTNNSIYDSRDNSNAIIEKGSNKLIAGCKTTIIPNTVTAIGNAAFYQMFSEGDYIFLEIPNSVTTIGDEAFWNNNGLMSVSIPSSVTNIGSRAFANCAHLEEVYVYHADPLAISDAFENCQYGLQYLYVPFGSLQAYKAAKGWRDFANIIEKLVTEILEPIESETTVDTEKLKNESLTNNVVGGIYYNVGANGYDATDGSIVISEVTSMSKIANSAPFSDDVKNNFCGMIISVAKGKGLFKANVKTSGDAQLVFQIGNDAPTIVKQDERGDVIIPYDVAEETYFYIYAIHVSSNAVKTRAEQEPLVKIYSITVSPGADMPKFKLTYTVDGKEYKSSELEYGASIKAEEAPTKEGYTFSGWSEIPQTMPAKDVTITGTFTVNKYKLTYTVDGKEYKTSEVEFGASITAEAAPTKEGYTFSGWSEVPKTMPAKDVTVTGTFTVNKYKLTYTVDGKEYKTSEVEYGASITAEAAPTKEGYTFSGWSEVPKTMPAKDVTITGTFTVNKYKLTYTVDGKEYKTSEVEYGASITAEAAPIKEGYTFSGWSEVPKTMPAKDVTITGTFTINKYKLTYTVDGKEYKTSEVEYGTSITAEAAPIKEGYTFSGWSEVPKTMPAKDVTVTGTFTVNKYKLTYTVDGKEYKTSEVEYGASITPEAAPTKEGYTFSGWSEVPKTMPAKDVTITGTFSKGSYKLTYVVDGETYKTVGYDFEAAITPEAEPTKEGYTFSGWSEIPKTMPAKDVTVTGTFTINKYKLTYTVDGKEYKTSEVEYGASITAETDPTKEGYTFSGWSEVPKTMPAKDVTVTGSFTINKYKLIYMVDGEEYKTYEVEFGSIITAEAEPTKEGYVFSGWSDVPSTMPAEDVTVTGTFIQTAIGEIRADGDSLRIYDLNGNRLDRTKSGVNIIRQADGKVRKVVVK